MRRRRLLAVSVAAVLVAVSAFCFVSLRQRKLVVYDADTGQVYGSWPVEDGTRFTVEFIHSVNKSPVKDEFETRGRDILAVRTIYSSFGAGVQTELRDGEKLEYDENGNMVVSGFDLKFERLNFIVGTVYDHVLAIGDDIVSLTELCGKNSAVVFEVR